ncbi:hypothetical protein [Halorhabdus rudnickae]|uniref:hypothetical protein n=1 Tax=Halorhabdus rudnickae TaxID=1775544 RepID=UPI00108387A7|nr:hypothetical protein [Halorhabdus rudnickae]
MCPRCDRAVVAGALLVVLLATVTIAAARPPPQPLCEGCSGDVVDGSDVESSTITIALDENGRGHWTGRLDLRANASINSQSVQSAAKDALRGHRDEATPRNLSVNASADAVTIGYDVPRMGHRSAGGVLIVDYFHSQGEQGRWYGVNVDRVVVTGPEGTQLIRAPEQYRLNETALAIDGEYGDTFARTISPGWYLTFGQDDGILTSVASHFGIGVDIAQLKGAAIPGTAIIPTIVLGACLAFRDRLAGTVADVSTKTAALSVVAIAGLAAAAAVTVGLDGATFLLVMSATLLAPLVALSLVLVGLQYGLLAGRFGFDLDARWIVRSAAVGVVLALLAAPLVAGSLGPIAIGYGSVVAVAAPTLFVPLALAERRPVRWLLAVVIVLSPLLLTLGWAPYGSYGAMYAPGLLAAWALLTAAIGMAGYTVGRARRDAIADRPSAQ